MLTVGSLFSGIGGFDLGFERVGMRVAWQVERDPWAREVLRTHWPEVPKYDDICTVHAGVVPRVDLLCGGFPCQDISLAGKGAGIEGTRSGLWAEFARLVGELRPRYVVVENVSALRSRGLDRVLGDLAACGYDAEWDCIPAVYVGAPHHRDRLFLVAYPDRAGRSGGTERYVFPTTRLEAPQRHHVDGLALAPGTAWAREPDVDRVGDGVPLRSHRLRGLGNALVPQIASWIGTQILADAQRQEGSHQ